MSSHVGLALLVRYKGGLLLLRHAHMYLLSPLHDHSWLLWCCSNHHGARGFGVLAAAVVAHAATTHTDQYRADHDAQDDGDQYPYAPLE